jgi:hypothetical protein
MEGRSGEGKQNEYTFRIDRERQLQISSAFESGNVRLVKQIHELYVSGGPRSTSWRQCPTSRD